MNFRHELFLIKVKEIAGNIIPAICSTNAMVAAIQGIDEF
jgi:hypothetical protein